MKSQIRKLLSEPLIQFLLLGALVFAVSGLVKGGITRNGQSEQSLVLPGDSRLQFIERYEREHGEQPGAEILRDFEQNWIKEEVLYKEGLALGLDQHDPVIRDRIIKKMQLLYAGQPSLDDPDDKALQQFLQQHHQRYVDAPRYRFQVIPASDSWQQDQLMTQALNNGADPNVLQLPLQQVLDKNEAYLVATWGREMVALLNQLDADGRWQRVEVKGQALLLNYQSYQGQSLPEFAELRPRLMADWRKQQRIQQVDQRVALLQQKYKVVWQE